MIRPLASLTLAAMLALAPAVATAEGDPTIDYSNADGAMNAAQAEAQSQLDRFLTHVLDENGIGQQGSGVKVAFATGGNDVEVIWVSPFGVRNGQMVGVLANQPQAIEGHNAGDTVAFEREQVRDWFFYGTDGKMYGSYTTRVMLADMSADTAAQISDMLSDSPAPADW